MIINNNIPALNTHRQMGVNQQANQNSMEKLSSGMRINRAGDDAAGLAISEKMRAQINGLDQASRNAQDGISLIQTAEGALDETHSILQRMRELAVQSSNDTNVEVDRQELQKEVDQLSQEITRIADTTQFNTQDLLDGGFEATFHIGANSNQNIELSIEDMGAEALGVAGIDTVGTDTLSELTFTNNTADDIQVVVADTGGGEVIEETTAELVDGVITVTLAQDGNNEATATYDKVADAINSLGAGLSVTVAEGEEDSLVGAAVVESDTTVDGSTFDDTKGINISSQEAADQAISTINQAIEDVSAQRSELGAYQNRLEHTISNLDNSSENLSAAESRIRDVDMAAEMMEMTRSNILSQASQSMLAQANQQPQSVLQLLG